MDNIKLRKGIKMKTLLLFVFLISMSVFGQKADTATIQTGSVWQPDSIRSLVVGSNDIHAVDFHYTSSFYFNTSSKESLYIDTILVVDSGKVNLTPILKVKIKEFQDFWDQFRSLNLTFYALQMAHYNQNEYPHAFNRFQESYNKWVDSKPSFDGFELYLTDKQFWLDFLDTIKTEIGEVR